MPFDIEIIELQPQPVLVVEAESAPHELGATLAGILPRVHACVSAQGGQMAGMPFMRYLNMTDAFHIEAGIPTVEPLSGEGDIVSRTLPGGRAATTLYLGPYDGVGAAWDALNAWSAEQDIHVNFGGWDIYENDPTTVADPSELRTRIVQPLPGPV